MIGWIFNIQHYGCSGANGRGREAAERYSIMSVGGNEYSRPWHDSSLFRSVINFIGLQLLSSNDKIIFGVWHLFNEKILKRWLEKMKIGWIMIEIRTYLITFETELTEFMYGMLEYSIIKGFAAVAKESLSLQTNSFFLIYISYIGFNFNKYIILPRLPFKHKIVTYKYSHSVFHLYDHIHFLGHPSIIQLFIYLYNNVGYIHLSWGCDFGVAIYDTPHSMSLMKMWGLGMGFISLGNERKSNNGLVCFCAFWERVDSWKGLNGEGQVESFGLHAVVR